jgi:TonB family protein
MKLRLLAVLSLYLLAAFGCATDKNRSPITRYDAELHDSVKKSWHDALQNVDQTRLKAGTVVVRFLLKSDGQISNIRIIENSSGAAEGLVVARAVMNHANYKPWPEGMAQMVGANYRLITFQFNYK